MDEVIPIVTVYKGLRQGGRYSPLGQLSVPGHTLGLVAGLSVGLLFASTSLGEQSVPLPLPILPPPQGSLLRVADPISPRLKSVGPIGFKVIAELPRSNGTAITMGDTNHDGRNEVIFLGGDPPYAYQIYEEQGNNLYSLQYTGAGFLLYAAGDLDGDLKSEVVGQSGPYLQVYESVDAYSYPTELVWSSFLSNVVGNPSIGDTDRDGRMEIIASQNSFGLVSILRIYENRGDNAFALVYSDTIQDDGAVGNKVVADFDGDGLTEIAFSGTYGRVYVYESTADDTWVRTWSVSTGLLNAYAVSVGNDTDGDGKPELFVMGGMSGAWTTMAYEPVGNNTFVRTATLSVRDGFGGEPFNVTANLDNSGRGEYVMDTATGLWVYRGSAPGQWDLVDQIPDELEHQAHDGIYAFDLNRNGFAELIWGGYPKTLILEQRTASAVGESRNTRSISLAAFPNPCRSQAELRVAGAVRDPARLGVYDVLGRLVERRALLREPQGRILWPTQHLSSGVYLLRLESTSGQALAVGRGVVAR